MPRVLIVEDEMLIRHLVCEELKDAGFEVEGARNGDEALVILGQGEAFDLVFTDVEMPGRIDGYQLGKWALSNIFDVRVIYASGHDYDQTPLSQRERRLKKPYQIFDILAAAASLGVSVS